MCFPEAAGCLCPPGVTAYTVTQLSAALAAAKRGCSFPCSSVGFFSRWIRGGVVWRSLGVSNPRLSDRSSNYREVRAERPPNHREGRGAERLRPHGPRPCPQRPRAGERGGGGSHGDGRWRPGVGAGPGGKRGIPEGTRGTGRNSGWERRWESGWGRAEALQGSGGRAAMPAPCPPSWPPRVPSGRHRSSAPLQVLLFLNGWYCATYFLLEAFVFVYKGESFAPEFFPIPPGLSGMC